MPTPTQATRHIAIETPLGEDVLLLQSFSAIEEVSSLFEFDLNLLSEDYEINFEDIIGQNVTISMELPEGEARYWNGYINRFVQGVTTSVQFAQYRATMVPWLWFLTRTSDCRIFQDQTVPDIVKQIFDDYGFSDIEDRLSGGYPTRKYCVQYRETDFNFVSRLMEQEGIYYYFFHEQDKCTIVLCDSLSKHDPYEGYEEIEYNPDVKSSALQEQIKNWTVEMAVRSGKFAYNDYNFLKPQTSLMSVEQDIKDHAAADFEIYDYPGEYPEKNDGDRYAKIRMEELSNMYEICTGQSDSRGICPGHIFTMEKHSRSDQNRNYLVIKGQYQASAEDYETSRGQGDIYNCTFSAIPGTVQFRPERKTPRPVIRGTQTAVVTGPSGEEIYTDENGQIKVQFHWDREGSYDENSSCWIRVSQVHAGKGFGGIDIPRIGEEVIVSFMEGNPDQPLITGRVYNAGLMPPFGLPNQKVVSGMKSNSTPGGGGYNEFTLNDTKGKEAITIHGQYNMDTTVQNNRSATLVSGNDTIAVKAGTRSVTVKGNTSLTVQAGSRTVSVTGGDYSSTASAAVKIHGKGAGVSITGESKGVTVSGAGKGVTVTGNGGSGVTITGTPNFAASGKSKATISSPEVDIGNKSVKVHGTKIQLSAGSGSIIIDAAGITIKGALVKIN